MAERGWKLSDKVCKVCGATFTPNTTTQLCCSKECSEENNRILQREYQKSYKKNQREKKQKAKETLALQRPSVCDSFCDGCVFLAWANGSLRVCEYFFHTGQRRPCPAGTGCTVKQKGRKKTAWRYEADRTWKNKEKRQKEKKLASGGNYADDQD